MSIPGWLQLPSEINYLRERELRERLELNVPNILDEHICRQFSCRQTKDKMLLSSIASVADSAKSGDLLIRFRFSSREAEAQSPDVAQSATMSMSELT